MIKYKDIEVDAPSNVYLPSDDSFLLLDSVDTRPGETVLDIGTGSGIVGIKLSKNQCKVDSIDINPEAVATAKMNAKNNKVALNVFQSDLFAKVDKKYDVIVFNPPYLPTDIDDLTGNWGFDVAVSGGIDGNITINRFMDDFPPYLSTNGRVYVVLCSHNDVHGIIEKLPPGFEAQKIGEKSFFFEKLYVYRFSKA